MSTTHLPEPRAAEPGAPRRPYRVIAVCTGNICRSAMAEAVLRDRLEALGVLGEAEVASAGVSDEERGNPMDSRARAVLREAGCTSGAAAQTIREHRAHRITDAEILQADLLLAMTARHHRELVRRAERLGAEASRIRMYRSFDPLAAPGEGGQDLDVPDPWYGTTADFQDTLEVVERVSGALAPLLQERVRE
ncbi:low molecular weight protein-tyrosine-phosphatase [Actinomyces bowdenii]|uniref:protein-tyrosine-phosphatase n=1 Tax=Actinomyces bowdenii TaxID=131109 RepID=A0A3P1V5Y4_9ACTO|nr:low molecular weight protein-tyrosine-phosphatase [Actinomyces bowdenii]RRD29066.1 low molecular weight phosphotyrosine protein phosphatase [Actinomyces bowdenii]